MAINNYLVHKHVDELEEALRRLIKDLDCTPEDILYTALNSTDAELAERLIWKAQLKLIDAARKEREDRIFGV